MLKKIFISILILSMLLLISCTNLDSFVQREEYNSKVSELEEANNIISNKSVEISGLKEELNTLENNLQLSEEENIKYEKLIANLNDLLSCVYYGWAINNIGGVEDGFTAFSISYNYKIYIITAGHCIKNEYGNFYNFKFKANFSNEWIYPELLTYKNDFNNNRDYAIFYLDKVIDGLSYDLNNSYPKFILGNMDNNILKDFYIYNLVEGESGSPVIDIDGEVQEMATGNSVDIDLIIQAIDNLK